MKIDNFYYEVKPEGAEGEKEKPWLIFLHGLLGRAANWRRIAPAFESDYNVLIYDQRGHGKSFKPKHGFSANEYSGDLKFLMDELKISKANIVGHSMGGRVALHFTHLNPQRVTKLVVEDIGPTTTHEFGEDLKSLLKSVPVPFRTKLEAKNYLLNELGDPRLGQFFYTSMVEDKDGQTTWIFDLDNIFETMDAGRVKDQWAEIKDLKCPTLVIRGEKSQALSKDEFEKILALNQHIKGVEIPDAGHWVHFEKPDKFIGELKNFLS